MQAPRRRRSVRQRRSSSSSGTAVACVAAVVALAAVMGLTMRKRGGEPRHARTPPVLSAEPAAPVAPEPPVARAAKPAHPLDVLARCVREAEREAPAIRRLDRGPAFEEARVGLLAQVSTARDELGAWLDAHPSDDRANRLWDRVLRLYVALQKL